jgi:putative hydrolase of the HAD superfamily
VSEPRQPAAVFFDLDGTLLDPSDATLEEDWRASCEACADGSFEVAQLMPHVHEVRNWFWKDAERARHGRLDLAWARQQIVIDAFERAGLKPDKELAARIGADYFERREAAMAMFPAAIATVEHFRAKGIGTALITNGGAEGQRAKVERFALEPYFDCIVIEGEFGCGKPDERVFRHALAATNSEPERTWMIGDNFDADITTPHRLGMHTVWIDTDALGRSPVASVTPHRIIRSIAELLASS